MQEPYFKAFIHALDACLNNFYYVISGFICAIIGYFIPVSNIVGLLLVFFILDIAFGFWAAHKEKNESFSVNIIWEKTVPRMLISVVMILGSFMWDNVYDQDVIATYKVIGWFISGLLLHSIAENGFIITQWSVFKKISFIFSDKVKKEIGFDHFEDDKGK